MTLEPDEVDGNFVSFLGNVSSYNTNNKVSPFLIGMDMLLIPSGISGTDDDGSISISSGRLEGVIIFVESNDHTSDQEIKFWKANKGEPFANVTFVDIGLIIPALQKGHFYSTPQLNPSLRQFGPGQHVGLSLSKPSGAQFTGINNLSVTACWSYDPDPLV